MYYKTAFLLADLHIDLLTSHSFIYFLTAAYQILFWPAKYFRSCTSVKALYVKEICYSINQWYLALSRVQKLKQLMSSILLAVRKYLNCFKFIFVQDWLKTDYSAEENTSPSIIPFLYKPHWWWLNIYNKKNDDLTMKWDAGIPAYS